MCSNHCFFILILIISSVVRENQAEYSNPSGDDNPNKLNRLEKINHSQLIEEISKLIDVKLQSAINDFSKIVNEAQNNLHNYLNNRLKTFEEKIIRTRTESLKPNDIMESMKVKSENSVKQQLSDESFESQKNKILIPLQQQVEKIQNSTNQPELQSIEICGQPKNCVESLENITFSDGIYQLCIPGASPFDAYCMQDREDKNSPAWTVIQRRRNGDVDFDRNWTEYKNGFGNLKDDFWLGLDRIHAITLSKQYELLIDLEDWEGEKRFAKYDNFAISNEDDGYRLKLGEYSGDATDSFSYHNNMKFTTKDVDNDLYKPENCAQLYGGAWWYNNCHYSNLNGVYNPTSSAEGVYWYFWHGINYSLKHAQMAIRPKELN